jgi:hypothetical protein
LGEKEIHLLDDPAEARGEDDRVPDLPVYVEIQFKRLTLEPIMTAPWHLVDITLWDRGFEFFDYTRYCGGYRIWILPLAPLISD